MALSRREQLDVALADVVGVVSCRASESAERRSWCGDLVYLVACMGRRPRELRVALLERDADIGNGAALRWWRIGSTARGAAVNSRWWRGRVVRLLGLVAIISPCCRRRRRRTYPPLSLANCQGVDVDDAGRARSRERVIVTTERRRPHRACAGRCATHVRAVVCAAVHRVAYCDRASAESLARLRQSRHRRRRASDEPRASRCDDRAPLTSSCVRRSSRRRTCAPWRGTAVCRVTPLRLVLSALHCRLGFARADTGDAERALRCKRAVSTERR